MPQPESGETKPKAAPVKLACVSCRTSRTRCDGEQPCYNCRIRDRECSYLASKRGGARKKRTRPADKDDAASTPKPCSLATLEQLGHLILPGAGLKRVEHDKKRQKVDAVGKNDESENDIGEYALRMYENEQEILNAYYTFIHPYFPILPPPIEAQSPDRPLKWRLATSEGPFPFNLSSPLSLALSAILVLIPLTPHELSGMRAAPSRLLRRSVAQRLAQLALDQIDADAEFLDFTPGGHSSPVLEKGQPINRAPLHPRAPVELESILTLLLLSQYEHMQRGNLLKMTTRASQALITAKNMSLHCLGPETDDFSEAKRRAWWMTYFRAHLCSVVRQSSTINVDDDGHFTTPYPCINGDPEAWEIFIESLRISVASVQLAGSPKTASSQSPEVLLRRYEELIKFDKRITHLTEKLEAQPKHLPLTRVQSSSELVTAKVLRCFSEIRLCSSRIRLHRYEAFSDIPLFYINHCDLKTPAFLISETDTSGSSNKLADLPTSVPFASSPFTYEQSVEICVESAFKIVRRLQSLPYPNAAYTDAMIRALPTISCCMMQASYILLMQFYRLHLMPQNNSLMSTADLRPSSERQVEELRHGLEGIISTLKGFASTFEAICGMRDDVEAAFALAFKAL